MIQLDRFDSGKLDRARAIVRDLDSVLVAFSGGVDSTLLLKLALDELGDRAVAVLASSPAYPESEQDEARATARSLGARLLAYGATSDDAGDHRPGHGSAVRRGVRFPLLEAGMVKAEIRAAARQLGLANWNKASFACLSSRIPHGTEVTVPALRRIEAAEHAIKLLGLRQVRVRDHGDVARIEVEPEEMPRLLANRERVVQALQDAGYKFVSLDLEGYSTGSLNRTWKPGVAR